MKNKIRLMKATLLASTLALMMVPLSAFAHAKLNTPTPRSDDTGDTTGPCGGQAPGTPVATYTAGTAINVQMEVVIKHPGPMYLSLSTAGDANFVQLGVYPENQNVDPTPQNPDVYNETITLPNTPCTNCTLQLKQFNSNEYYYSCSDITIVAASGTPTPTPSPSPTMSATPTPTPSGSGPISTQGLGSSNTSNNGGAQMGSCGSVHDSKGGPGQGPGAALMIFLPLALMILLRKKVRVRA